MRHNTSIVIEDGVVDSLRDLGYTLSGFTQTAVDVLLSEGFDDFAMALKLKLLEQEELDIDEEIIKSEARIAYLRRQKQRVEELRGIVHRNYEAAKASAVTCNLIDKLNHAIIMSGYDIESVKKTNKDTINELKNLNKDFDLARHIERIKKLVT